LKNIVQVRQKYKSSLRKDHLEEMILKKREKVFEKNEEISHLEITAEKLKLPPQYVQNNLDVNILNINLIQNISLDYIFTLIESPDLNPIKLGIFLFKTLISQINNSSMIDLYNKKFLHTFQKILDMYTPVESVVVSDDLYGYLFFI
jgi:hypothetical protein